MKLSRYTWFIALIAILIPACSWGIAIKPATQITVTAETIYLDGNVAEPDSVRVLVTYNGAEVYDVWFNSGDAECAAEAGRLIFTDQLQDIDGAGGVGVYHIEARAYDNDSTLYTPWVYMFEVGTADTLTQIHADQLTTDGVVDSIYDSTKTSDPNDIYAKFIDGSNEDQFKADVSALATATALQTVDDELAVVDGNVDDIETILGTPANFMADVSALATAANQTLIIDSLQAVLDSIQNHNAWLTAFVDTLLANGFVTYSNGGDSILRLGGFYVIANSLDSGAFYLKNSSGVGVKITGSTTGIYSYGISGDGAHFKGGDDGIYAYGGDDGFYAYGVDDGIYAVGAVGSGFNTGGLIEGTITPTDTTKSGYPIDTLGSIDGGGTGDYTVTIAAVDTLDTDTALADTKISVFNASGAEVGNRRTSTGGTTTFTLDAGTYTVKGRKTGWLFDDYSLTFTTDSTDTIAGYNITIGAPGDANTCRVYGYVPDAANAKLGGVNVWGYIDGSNIVDTSTSEIVANIPVRSRDSDSTGYWYLDLRWSSKLDGGTDGTYDINGYYNGKMIFNVDDLTVPDLESFNLADTMEAR